MYIQGRQRLEIYCSEALQIALLSGNYPRLVLLHGTNLVAKQTAEEGSRTSANVSIFANIVRQTVKAASRQGFSTAPLSPSCRGSNWFFFAEILHVCIGQGACSSQGGRGRPSAAHETGVCFLATSPEA